MASLNLSRNNTAPPRSLSGSYSAVTVLPRGRPAGNSPASTSTAPIFEPRIIRATNTPNPPRDPACVLPFAPSTSPVTSRPRRLSSALRSANPTSASTPVHRSVPPPSSTTYAHGFPRPAYLEYSSLRDLLHTDAAPALPATGRIGYAYTLSSGSADTSVGGSPAPTIIPYPHRRRELTPQLDSDDESTASPPPPAVGPAAPGTSTTMLSVNPVLRLPTRWSEQDRLPALSISADGRELTFCGPSCVGDRESSAARANHPIPPACGIYYYEVEILQRSAKGCVHSPSNVRCGLWPSRIAFSSPDVRLSRLPGWEKNSWGYHADDGCSFAGQKDGSPYGPTFDAGDIIGCGVDFSQNRAFYTKNGAFLGMVFDNVGKSTELYPSIGMRHTAEAVRANFGNAPFKYAIEDHVRAQRDATWTSVMTTRVDLELLRLSSKTRDPGEAETRSSKESMEEMEEEEKRAPMRQLVLAYLAHHGYARTAHAFQKQCAERSRVLPPREKDIPQVTLNAHDADADADVLMETDETPSNDTHTRSYSFGPSSTANASSASSSIDYGLDRELHTRLEITNTILRGDMDSALALTSVHYPAVLKREQGLVLFHMRCRKFVELVLQAGDALRRVKEAERIRMEKEREEESAEAEAMDGAGAMDVDDPSSEAQSMITAPPVSKNVPSALSLTAPSAASGPVSASHTALSAEAKSALNTAIAYGQTLEADYKTDTRPVIRTHLRRTFGVVAYEDPCAAGGEVGEIAGQEARVTLAAEVNQAILESQGRPAHPALESMFRQAGACVVQLGLLGVGAAAFADVRKEFLEA
ncbi:Ran-binding protein 9 [Grifola frondosa]|uniref:Ran-binding protein 9 n=1 Tax=Grifola frondosa TaxID=5627 RepID=A0A1C7MTW5_GRIFR|nr:Ran-binding protein 9 [Grifola frondosa]